MEPRIFNNTLPHRKTLREGKRKLRKKKLTFESSDSDTFEEKVVDDSCSFCKEFERGSKRWFRCIACGPHAHEECSGWDTPEEYNCDSCSN